MEDYMSAKMDDIAISPWVLDEQYINNLKSEISRLQKRALKAEELLCAAHKDTARIEWLSAWLYSPKQIVPSLTIELGDDDSIARNTVFLLADADELLSEGMTLRDAIDNAMVAKP